MICSEEIYHKAREIVRRCGTRDPLRIAQELGIYVDYIDNFDALLGMYTYRYKERHILLNSKMDAMLTRMVFGHEIGHDTIHHDLARRNDMLPEFVLFDIRTRHEYEANTFAAHLCIDDEEMLDYLSRGFDVNQLAAAMNTNVNLMLIKLNEMNNMGCSLNLPFLPKSDFLKNIKPES